MKLRSIRRTAAAVIVAAGLLSTAVTTPASAHTIRCGETAYQPVKSGTAVVATAIVSCTDRPDHFYAEYTMWAWTGTKYIG